MNYFLKFKLVFWGFKIYPIIKNLKLRADYAQTIITKVMLKVEYK